MPLRLNVPLQSPRPGPQEREPRTTRAHELAELAQQERSLEQKEVLHKGRRYTSDGTLEVTPFTKRRTDVVETRMNPIQIGKIAATLPGYGIS